MKNIIQTFVLLLALSVVASPAMAKEEKTSNSSKSKSSEVKKAKKKTASTKDKKAKVTEETKSSTKETASKSSKSTKSSSSSSASKSSKSPTSSSSSKKTTASKKSIKSGLTETDKAKKFKSITVNINKADAATLAHYLVGIGETRAKDIIKYRKKNGNFKSVEDLKNVPGIGEATYAGIKKNTSTSRGETSKPSKTKSASKK